MQVLGEVIAAGLRSFRPGDVVSLTASYACNFRCIHCYQDAARDTRLRREAAIDEVLALVPVLDQIIPGGGEPLLHPLWRRFFNDPGLSANPYLQLSITTNASLVSDEILAGLAASTAGPQVSPRRGSRPCSRPCPQRPLDSFVGKSTDDRTGAAARARLRRLRDHVGDEGNFLESRTCRVPPSVGSPSSFAGRLHAGGPKPHCFNDPATETAGWRDALREAETDSLIFPAGPGRPAPQHTLSHRRTVRPWKVRDQRHEVVEGVCRSGSCATAGSIRREVLVGSFPWRG